MNRTSTELRPWPALWSLVLGFFMILIDTTIVSVANPTIMQGLDATMTATLWATSAYLLAYAVPLLITGRLGDRYGPKRLYLIGLSLFTLSSLACGFSPTIELLILARVAQGLGAALMTPQTMAVITRIFPPRERGSAMAVWGVTAGVATLVGPILGGFILDGLGWEWIFFINVPVGIIGFALAARYVPTLETHAHRFDWLGVILSAFGMFCLVFGLQEGETFEWGTIWGPVSVWTLIAAGVVVLALFVVWQHRQRGEPLLPLVVFHDRNFSVGSAAIAMVGFTVTGLSLPLMFYFQLVRGLSPSQAALMLVPMAVISGGLARPVGRAIDRGDPRRIALVGLVLQALGIVLYAMWISPDAPIWLLLIPSAILGFSNAFMWGSLAAITTFGLPLPLAGAGSGVYNTSRQVGAVLGSAAMAALMAARLETWLGSAAGGPAGAAGVGAGAGGSDSGGAGGSGSGGSDVSGGLAVLPEHLQEGFARAMAESLYMPAAAIIVGALLTLLFAPRPPRTGPITVVPSSAPGPGTEQPNAQQPGTEQLGAQQPGTEQPGAKTS